uniref:Uncharacterized protein n=1 Tax=Kalanchoe fedtschenkoi TaxID=63787 RepID=A0A7N0SWA5_KALFE
MPSGAKRRKAAAAKKKKEQAAPTGPEAGSFNGVEDLKGQESDGGEAGSSPGSQDVLGDRGSSPVRQNESEKDVVEEVVVGVEVGVVKVDADEGGVEITRELEPVEVLESRDLGKSDGGSSASSSSSSSSDDEKVDVEKTEPAQDSAEVVETVVDVAAPVLADEEVVIVSEAPPAEELPEDLDEPVLLESSSEMNATTEVALPVHAPTIESHGESSQVDPSDVKDAEDKVPTSSYSPVAATSNGGVHLKDQEIHGSTENQTPEPQAPLPVQRTSWKGCCGLFEVFAGSR